MFGLFKKIKIIDDLMKNVEVLNTKLDAVSVENATLKKQIEEFKELVEDIKTQNRPIPYIVEIVYDLQKDVDVIKKFQTAKLERWEKNRRLSDSGKNRQYRRN